MKAKIASLLLTIISLIITAPAQNYDPSNKLSMAEEDAGWRLLFDGKSFKGWRGFHSDQVPTGWTIEDGCIKKIPAQSAVGLLAGGDLITADEYDNFEFS